MRSSCDYLSLIFTEAFLFVPSVEIAVIVTFLPLPAFLVVTTPFFTVAHFSLEERHNRIYSDNLELCVRLNTDKTSNQRRQGLSDRLLGSTV